MKKGDAKKLKSEQTKAKRQLLDYMNASNKLKDLKDLQAWTVVVIKDEVYAKRVN